MSSPPQQPGIDANGFAERHDFLDGITKWSLRQCTSVKCIWRIRPFNFPPRKYGEADLLFWWNEKGNAVVTFRLGETPAGEGPWITGHRKRFPDMSALI